MEMEIRGERERRKEIDEAGLCDVCEPKVCIDDG
jgi:hypothetical protein